MLPKSDHLKLGHRIADHAHSMGEAHVYSGEVGHPIQSDVGRPFQAKQHWRDLCNKVAAFVQVRIVPPQRIALQMNAVGIVYQPIQQRV